MPKGPQGQKRPADTVGAAVMVGRIATGEEVEEISSSNKGAAGGRARAEALSSEERSKIAAKAAEARWSADESPDMELNMSELSILKKELFGDPSSAITDIKFYPGESTECSPDDIAGAIRAAISDVKEGNGEDIDLSF
jgi:hypothetical protein